MFMYLNFFNMLLGGGGKKGCNYYYCVGYICNMYLCIDK